MCVNGSMAKRPRRKRRGEARGRGREKGGKGEGKGVSGSCHFAALWMDFCGRLRREWAGRPTNRRCAEAEPAAAPA